MYDRMLSKDNDLCRCRYHEGGSHRTRLFPIGFHPMNQRLITSNMGSAIAGGAIGTVDAFAHVGISNGRCQGGSENAGVGGDG